MDRRTKQKKKQVIFYSTIVLGIVVAFAGYFGVRIFQTLNRTYHPVERIDNTDMSINKEKRSLTNTKAYLLLGVDERPEDKGRTDTMILAIVNDHTKKITLISIPRDTYTKIYGRKAKDKINSAYNYGLSTTIATVERFTGIPIDHYALVNLEGFKKAIDTIGGITVTVDESAAKGINKEHPNVHLEPGEQLLKGEEAMWFSRFRHDAMGDFGRIERQQLVLKALLDQSIEVRSPKKVNGLLDVLGEDVRTDLTPTQIISLAAQMNDFNSSNMEQIRYKADSKRLGPQNLWYVLIDEEERLRVEELLKNRYESMSESALLPTTSTVN